MKKIIALLAMIAGLATAGTLTFDTINADTAGTVTGTQSNALVSVQSQATANSETGVTHTASIAANVIDIAALEAAVDVVDEGDVGGQFHIVAFMPHGIAVPRDHVEVLGHRHDLAKRGHRSPPLRSTLPVW